MPHLAFECGGDLRSVGATVEQGCADRDIRAQQRLYSEGVEAALQFPAAIQADVVLGWSAGLVVADQGALAIA